MSILPDAESFRRLVQGVDRGLAASVARMLLQAASVPYGLGVAARTLAFDRRWLRIASSPVPVISVGNLTLGGTGKSPLVGWVADTLSGGGLSPAVVSRGYGARGDSCLERSRSSDEGREFALTHPDIPHLAHPRRLEAVREAAVRHAADVVVLDDGFQHRKLERVLDIVAVDATDPVGGGRLFPRGLLREPVDSLRRADCIVLTRCERVPPGEPARIRASLEKACGGLPGITWAESCHAPFGLRSVGGSSHPPDFLRGRRVMAICGIGNPRPFRQGLEDQGAIVADHIEFADHHAYGHDDLETILRRGRDNHVELIVTTLKDIVKIDASRFTEIPLMALEVRLKILSGEEELRSHLLRSVGPRGSGQEAISSSRRGACASGAEENTS